MIALSWRSIIGKRKQKHGKRMKAYLSNRQIGYYIAYSPSFNIHSMEVSRFEANFLYCWSFHKRIDKGCE